MREMKAKTLKNVMQQTIQRTKKLEPKNFAEEIQLSKAIGYLVSVASQVIQRHELEQRLDELERRIDASH